MLLARLSRIEDKLTNIQITLARLATRDTIRNWGLALVAIVIATWLAICGIMLRSSGNQLSAFQDGLSAIQAVTAGHRSVGHRPTTKKSPVDNPDAIR